MRRIRLILLLLGIMLAVGIVGAQEEEIVINLSGESSDIAPAYSSTIETLTQNLSALGYETVFVEDGLAANIGLNPHQARYTEGYEIATEVFTFEGELPSLLLYESYGIVDFPIDSAISEHISNLLTALSLYSVGDCENAIPYFESVKENVQAIYNGHNTYNAIHFYLGTCHLSLENYELAFEPLWAAFSHGMFDGVVFNSAIAINHSWLFISHTSLYGDVPYAENPTGILRHIDCTHATSDCTLEHILDVLPRRAQLYALGFDYDNAIADMDTAIALAEENEVDNTTLAELYTIRGKIVFLLYEWDRVLADFNHAIELDPNYAPAYFERGVLYYTMTQRENALADFEHYLELEPDGLYTDEATTYIESIHTELEALGG